MILLNICTLDVLSTKRDSNNLQLAAIVSWVEATKMESLLQTFRSQYQITVTELLDFFSIPKVASGYRFSFLRKQDW